MPRIFFTASTEVPFDLVFLIRLRFVRKNQSLDDVIMNQHRQIEPERVPSGYIKSVLKNKTGIRVLLMLDGYDEYTPGTNRDIDRMIESGIGNCFLILTSRPGEYLKKEIRDQMDGEIVIEGFSDQQIRECTNNYLKNMTLSTKMLMQAKRAGIYDLLRVPVIMTMTAAVFRKQNSLPRSKTALYDTIFRLIIQRTTLKTFDKTQNRITHQENLLDTLGEISWEALKNDQLLLKKVR